MVLQATSILTSPLGHRGLGRTAKFLSRWIFPSDDSVEVIVHSRSHFVVALSDPYWVLLLCPGYKYEPELAATLPHFFAGEVAFLDCGANHGYWSLLAAEHIASPMRVLAVEASTTTHSILCKHAVSNNGGFNPLHAALSDQAGTRLSFITVKDNHAGAFVLGAKKLAHNRPASREEVDSVTLDSLVNRHLPEFSGSVVVKLDVEGNEIAAMQGAVHLLERDVLIIFEELGADQGVRVWPWFLEHTDYDVYSFDTASSKFRLESASTLPELKRQSSCTPNLFACRHGGHFAQKIADYGLGGDRACEG